jgi:hypothetical protein
MEGTMTTEIHIYTTDEDALGGCDPDGLDVEATQDRLADMCQSELEAAYPDAVVTGDTRTEDGLSATRTPRYQVTIPWEAIPDDLDRYIATSEMEADVQGICEDTWERQAHWVWAGGR